MSNNEPAILRLNHIVLRRLITHIITPEWDAQVTAQPGLLTFYALSQTCRTLRFALVRPDDDEGYWRSILLDVGQGRPYPQQVKPSPGSTETLPSSDKHESWASVARQLARDVFHGIRLYSYRGRGAVTPISAKTSADKYYAASRKKFARLPPCPMPTVHRVLTKDQTSAYNVLLNYPALGLEVHPHTAYGTFCTRPAIPEVKLYFTIDKTRATEVADICYEFGLPLNGLAVENGVELDREGVPINSILNNTPVIVTNPDGVTREDLIRAISTWLETGESHPFLMMCEDMIELAGEMDLNIPLPFKPHYWFQPIFARPFSTKHPRDDWQFLSVNGGNLFVRIGLDHLELFDALEEANQIHFTNTANLFNTIMGRVLLGAAPPANSSTACNCPHCFFLAASGDLD